MLLLLVTTRMKLSKFTPFEDDQKALIPVMMVACENFFTFYNSIFKYKYKSQYIYLKEKYTPGRS